VRTLRLSATASNRRVSSGLITSGNLLGLAGCDRSRLRGPVTAASRETGTAARSQCGCGRRCSHSSAKGAAGTGKCPRLSPCRARASKTPRIACSWRCGFSACGYGARAFMFSIMRWRKGADSFRSHGQLLSGMRLTTPRSSRQEPCLLPTISTPFAVLVGRPSAPRATA
jgi:hypothetical protein